MTDLSDPEIPVIEHDPFIPRNPELGPPVHPDNDWHVPEIIGRWWLYGELQDALANLGFKPTATDPNMKVPCPCQMQPGVRTNAEGCEFCDGTSEVDMPLTLHRRWVKGDMALRLSMNRDKPASPGLAACVIGAMAKA